MNQVLLKTFLFFCSFFPFNFPALLPCHLPCPRFLVFQIWGVIDVGDQGEDTKWEGKALGMRPLPLA